MGLNWGRCFLHEVQSGPTRTNIPHKHGEMVLRIAEHILKVGKMLTELGQKDAREGKRAYPATFFPDLVVKAFRLDVGKTHEMVQAVADLWQSDYMNGYNDI